MGKSDVQQLEKAIHLLIDFHRLAIDHRVRVPDMAMVMAIARAIAMAKAMAKAIHIALSIIS